MRPLSEKLLVTAEKFLEASTSMRYRRVLHGREGKYAATRREEKVKTLYSPSLVLLQQELYGT